MSKNNEPHKRIDFDSPKMDWVVDQLFTDPTEGETSTPHSFEIWISPEK